MSSRTGTTSPTKPAMTTNSHRSGARCAPSLPGSSDANITAVTQGLEPGEIIAMDNFNKLGEGVKVTLRKPGDAAQAGGGKRQAAARTAKKPDDAKDSP